MITRTVSVRKEKVGISSDAEHASEVRHPHDLPGWRGRMSGNWWGVIRLKFRLSELNCRGERIVARGFVVGRDAGTLPVGPGDGVDGAGDGDRDAEMRVDGEATDGMGAAAGRFADNRGALEVLEVVGELFGTREGSLGGEDVDGLRGEPLAGHPGQRPVLCRLVIASVVQVVDVLVGVEEIRDD